MIINKCTVISLTIELNDNGIVGRCPIETGMACIIPCRDLRYLHDTGPCRISNPDLGEVDPRWRGPLPLEEAIIGHSTGEVGS